MASVIQETGTGAFYPLWESVSQDQSDPFVKASLDDPDLELVDILPAEHSPRPKTHTVLRHLGAMIVGVELGIMADLFSYRGLGFEGSTATYVGAFVAGAAYNVVRGVTK